MDPGVDPPGRGSAGSWIRRVVDPVVDPPGRGFGRGSGRGSAGSSIRSWIRSWIRRVVDSVVDPPGHPVVDLRPGRGPARSWIPIQRWRNLRLTCPSTTLPPIHPKPIRKHAQLIAVLGQQGYLSSERIKNDIPLRRSFDCQNRPTKKMLPTPTHHGSQKDSLKFHPFRQRSFWATPKQFIISLF